METTPAFKWLKIRRGRVVHAVALTETGGRGLCGEVGWAPLDWWSPDEDAKYCRTCLRRKEVHL